MTFAYLLLELVKIHQTQIDAKLVHSASVLKKVNSLALIFNKLLGFTVHNKIPAIMK